MKFKRLSTLIAAFFIIVSLFSVVSASFTDIRPDTALQDVAEYLVPKKASFRAMRTEPSVPTVSLQEPKRQQLSFVREIFRFLTKTAYTAMCRTVTGAENLL